MVTHYAYSPLIDLFNGNKIVYSKMLQCCHPVFRKRRILRVTLPSPQGFSSACMYIVSRLSLVGCSILKLHLLVLIFTF